MCNPCALQLKIIIADTVLQILEIPNFEQLQASLNTLMLNVYYDFNACLNKGLFADLLIDLDERVVQSDDE